MDGSSTTAYKYKGIFGVCSRNWELEENEKNGYWIIANKYNLKEKLTEGYALQWETCGPNIQSNPMDLKEIEGFAFSAYNIANRTYLNMKTFLSLCKLVNFPTCKIIEMGDCFDKKNVENLGEGLYSNGKPREGVVVRSQRNLYVHKPVSFKVINLDYEK